VTLEIKSTTAAAESDPYSMFLFAMRSPKTREKCTGRLRMFFDFLDIKHEEIFPLVLKIIQLSKGRIYLKPS
jgi:hypothetical protein